MPEVNKQPQETPTGPRAMSWEDGDEGALGPAAGGAGQLNLAAILDIPLRLTVELGRAELPLGEVLALAPGAVVELDRFPGEPLDLYANGRLIARGEIIVLNDIFGFRVTEVLTGQAERVGL
jgi:flagellar motor switch protein FliN